MDSSVILDRLYEIIQDRKNNPPEKSYVVKLLQGGVAKMGAKVIEEADELVESAATDDDAHTIYEAADLLFHVLVLLGSKDIHPDKVLGELGRRFGVSGITEKESRKEPKNNDNGK